MALPSPNDTPRDPVSIRSRKYMCMYMVTLEAHPTGVRHDQKLPFGFFTTTLVWSWFIKPPRAMMLISLLLSQLTGKINPL
ncbi:hypothetical protein CFAM422_006363 [Trichoderma lentiforme]|uniref:Uncharacterized protein n=1 Tax=Trichoderma lentiforme TaxID=1567552 RepID=A0A9P5CEU4_9HYPO|nr:hypothetical protein CFAM422_006363 [Trichoderma lentiforme]